MIHVRMAEHDVGRARGVERLRQQPCRIAGRVERAPRIQDQPRAVSGGELDARSTNLLRAAMNRQGKGQSPAPWRGGRAFEASAEVA